MIVLVAACMVIAFGLQVMSMWQTRVVNTIFYVSFAMLFFTAAGILARFL